MEQTQLCPACGAANPIDRKSCQICAQLFYPEPQPWEHLKLQELPSRDLSSPEARQHFQVPSHIKPIRTTTRRKVLAGLVGSVAILGLGAPALEQLLQNIQVAFTTRNFPDDNYQDLLTLRGSFSSDLNLMAMSSMKENDGLLYIWDYQQQRMTTLLAQLSTDWIAWSSDNKYLLYDRRHMDNNSITLDIWDVRARKRLGSFSKNNDTLNPNYYFSNGKIVNWSPDDSQIGLLLTSSLMVIDAMKLTSLLALNVSPNSEMFTWSPDGQKIALLVGQDNTSWSVQIWNIQTRQMEAELPFQGTLGDYPSMLEWSPYGTHVAVLSRKQLQIIHMTKTISSYPLDEPNDHGLLAWSPDGKYLAVAVSFHADLEYGEYEDEPHPFGIWDVAARTKIHSFGNGTLDDLPNALGWSKDGSHIITIDDTYQQENWYWL